MASIAQGRRPCPRASVCGRTTMARPAPPAWPEIRSGGQLKPAQEPTPGLVGGCSARSRIIVASAITPPHYAARIPAISPGAPFVDRAARVLSARRPDDRPLSTLLIACNSRPQGRDDRRSLNGGPAALSASGGITVRVTPTAAAHALRTPRVRPAPIDGQRCVTGQLQAHATVFSLPGHVEPTTNTTTVSHYKPHI